MAESDYAEPAYAQHQDKSKVPYYITDLSDRISPEVSFFGALQSFHGRFGC